MSSPDKSDIAIVSIHYSRTYVKPTLETLDRLSHLVNSSEVILVSNNPMLVDRLRSSKHPVLLHDNVGAEFGAYHAGLRALSRDSAAVLIINDTVATHDHFTRFNRRRLCELATYVSRLDHPAIVGKVQSISRSFEIGLHRSNRWVTSNAFVVNRAALDVLGHRLYDPALDSLVKGGADRDDFFSPAVSPVLVEHLSQWLFGLGYGKSWYGVKSLASNTERMRLKARSILQEKRLSAALESAGAEFFDIEPVSRLDRNTNVLEKRWIDVRRWLAAL